ncbi:hypothetical protein [Chitinophaga caseinilytica]|uniref:Uncharacterized protein n=1 Tax=Chitinophaga caseinilytica TaxID=2267521 RepID=A0ABZ2YY64_9BACT
MKTTLCTFWLLLAAIIEVCGQPAERRDTASIAAWRTAVRRAPVLTGATSPRTIVPHEPSLCFNMEFDLKITMPGKMAEQCMFVNNSTGVIGLLPAREDGLINMLFPELPDFSFDVMNMTGNVYRYHTNKGKNNTIERWVTTGFSDQNPYLQAAAMFDGSADLQRKGVTATYCDGRMTAVAYRFSTHPGMTWYVYGDRYPEKLHPRKFLGNMGVGYLKTDEGLYIITEFRSEGYSCRVTNIEPANACLHTESFVPREAEYSRQANLNIEKEKEKLDRAATAGGGPCAGERSLLIDFKKEQARKREAALAQAREGNVYQQNSNAQRSMASMMDPLAVVQEDILNAKLEICKAENSTSARSRERIGCLNNQLSALMRIEGELRALDARHANQPGMAFAEKSKLYMRNKPRGCP